MNFRPSATRSPGRYTYRGEIVTAVWTCDHAHRTERGAVTCASKHIDANPATQPRPNPSAEEASE